MGLLDFFSGRKTPEAGMAPQPAAAVRSALLALDRQTAPWTVREAAAGEEADLIAEWRIVDARWFAVFGAAGLQETFAIHMRLHEDLHEVRTVDHSRSLDWSTGVPVLAAGWQVTRGRQVSVEFGKAYAFTEQLQFGQVYNYRFNSSEMRHPLEQATLAQGWSWRAALLSPL